jgi:sulfur-oxidizing protein SoxB
MDDILSQTAMTYPEVYVQPMSGEQIKVVLEDICDNLFNLDPYYQQGGDMVRIGGMSYTCAPNETTGKRISDMKLGGVALDPAKSYKVAGWASVNEQKGKPVWESVAGYLRDTKPKPKSAGSRVKIVGVEDNPGYAGQA